jgi:predicted PurR-regulated permease PerM
VQQVENHVIMPFVQRWAIALPPALGIFAVVALGYLLGPLGVILATPLTVVLFVLAKQLYLRDTLGEQVPIRG